MKKKLHSRFIISLALLLLVLCSDSFSQGIHTSLDKKDILIGQQITYTLSIDLPSADYKIAMDIPDSVPHFEVLQKNAGNAADKKGNYSWICRIVFTSFDSGTWSFPPLSYRINHLNTSSQPLATDSFRINVGYMPIDAGGKPRDIKTILEVSWFDRFWIWVGAGILVLLVFLFFLIRYLRKRKKPAAQIAAVGAFDEAMKKLAGLKTANETNAMPVKDYHTALANVLKEYYGKRVNKDFANNTTGEILSRLRSHELLAETHAHTAEALQTGDAVKFAKYHSSYTENEAALNYLKSTIKEIEHTLTKKV